MATSKVILGGAQPVKGACPDCGAKGGTVLCVGGISVAATLTKGKAEAKISVKDSDVRLECSKCGWRST